MKEAKMENVKNDIAKSLEINNLDLLEYIPYLFQDLFDMGTNPSSVLEIIRKYNILKSTDAKVLDLGCGKGAVSIAIAKELRFKVYGIDLMEAFIEEARTYASKFGVAELCRFDVGDIKDIVKTEIGCDLIIFGAVGQIFGGYKNTLSSINKCIKNGGFLIIDDCYIDDDSDYSDKNYVKHSSLLKIINESEFVLLDEKIESNVQATNQRYFVSIKKRAEELKKRYPEKVSLFEDYVRTQADENYVLENKVKCAVFVLKKKNLSSKNSAKIF